MRHRLLLLLLVILCVPAFLHAQALGYSDRDVGGIEVDIAKSASNAAFDPQSIRSQLKTTEGKPFTQLDFDQDLKQLSQDFDKVEPELTVRGDKVYIVLHLWPKPAIRSITFEGNHSFRSAKLLKELDIKTGALFERHVFNLAFHKLRAYYIKKGFFEAKLSYVAVPDPNTNDVDIQVNIDEGRSGRVKKLRFNGLTNKEQLELVKQIHTKQYEFLSSWLSKAGTYQEEAVEQDRYIVLNFLHDQGYADAQVKLDLQDTEDGSGINLTFEIVKGPIYKVNQVSISGNTLFTEEQIRKALNLKPGDLYSPEQLRKSVESVNTLYGSKGYIEAVANIEPRLVPDQPLFDLNITITEGEQFKVGMVRVFGNESTQQRVILHESQVCPGEVFDTRKLQYTEAVLQNIGYFEHVHAYAVRSPQENDLGPQYRDVYIEVQEQQTGSIGVFGGLSTIDNLNGGVELTEQNFNIRGLMRVPKCGLGSLRGGGEYLRARLNIGKKQRSIIVSWTKPFFNDTRWVVGVDLERSISNLISNKYSIRSYSLGLHATYPCNKFVRFGPHYRARYVNTNISRDLQKSSMRHLPMEVPGSIKHNSNARPKATALYLPSAGHGPMTLWTSFAPVVFAPSSKVRWPVWVGASASSHLRILTPTTTRCGEVPYSRRAMTLAS